MGYPDGSIVKDSPGMIVCIHCRVSNCCSVHCSHLNFTRGVIRLNCIHARSVTSVPKGRSTSTIDVFHGTRKETEKGPAHHSRQLALGFVPALGGDRELRNSSTCNVLQQHQTNPCKNKHATKHRNMSHCYYLRAHTSDRVVLQRPCNS